MPAINLRLTDEQHQLLVDAAHSHRRSLQKEIVERLFGVALPEGERGSAATRSPSESATAGGRESAPGPATNALPSTAQAGTPPGAEPPAPDPELGQHVSTDGTHFKPDWKAPGKKKR